MSVKFLLDTNIISESIKLQPNDIFLEHFRENLEESAIAPIPEKRSPLHPKQAIALEIRSKMSLCP